MKTVLVLFLFLGDKAPVIDHVQMLDEKSCQVAGELIVKKYTDAVSKRWDPGTVYLDSYYVCVSN